MSVVNHQYSADSVLYSGASEIVEEPTWISGITEGVNHNPITLVRRGSLVTVTGLMFVASPISSSTDLSFLPTGFRPAKTVVAKGVTHNSSGVNVDVVFNVNPNGSFVNDSLGVRDYFFVDFSYLVED